MCSGNNGQRQDKQLPPEPAKMGAKAIILVVVVCFFATSLVFGKNPDKFEALRRENFPQGFVFGTASSAYQYEGGADEGGRGPSIWDAFASLPGKIRDGSNGNVADDSYHRYKEDVKTIDDIGFDSYRFSISWSRLLPGGHLGGGVNQEGIDYYNNLINELRSKGIKPFVTIFHWDVPETLQQEYGGFLSSKIVDDFRDYADLCFRSFGDRVKHWITLNEPLSVSNNGYTTGKDAPGRCSSWYSSNCTGGDSGTEPYIVAHNQLLAHAAAVKVYRDSYQVPQKGQIGITLDCKWILPMTPSYADRQAASRLVIFQFDWFMEPLNSGVYPIEMVTYVGRRLPRFTREQSMLVKGSFDFIGVNYYTSYYGTAVPCKTGNFSYSTDSCAETSVERNGILIGPETAADWLYVYPEGILDLMLYMKYKYSNPDMYITENGYCEMNTGSVMLEDDNRVYYYRSHLSFLQNAITMGVNIKGYFAWSLLDNFEWHDGYTLRFGIVFVDYKDGLQRYMKTSALWFKEFLKGGNPSRPRLHSSL